MGRKEGASKVPSEPGGGLGSASLSGQGPIRSDARLYCVGMIWRAVFPVFL